MVIDPYCQGVLHRRKYGLKGRPLKYESPDILGLGDTWPQMGGMLPLGYAAGSTDFDWEGDTPPGLDTADLIVYEAHVRAFT